jgi:hypothetical protein
VGLMTDVCVALYVLVGGILIVAVLRAHKHEAVRGTTTLRLSEADGEAEGETEGSSACSAPCVHEVLLGLARVTLMVLMFVSAGALGAHFAAGLFLAVCACACVLVCVRVFVCVCE